MGDLRHAFQLRFADNRSIQHTEVAFRMMILLESWSIVLSTKLIGVRAGTRPARLENKAIIHLEPVWPGRPLPVRPAWQVDGRVG
jgi:hypothetical protein